MQVYWYTGTGKAMRYGVPFWDVFRLPQTSHPWFSKDPPPVSEYSGERPVVWLAASVAVSLGDLKKLRPALAQMHPVRRASVDTSPTGGPIGDRMVRRVVQTLRSKGVRVNDYPMANVGNRETHPWSTVPKVLQIRYADAIDNMNIDQLAKSMRGSSVSVESRGFRSGEPQIWIRKS